MYSSPAALRCTPMVAIGTSPPVREGDRTRTANPLSHPPNTPNFVHRRGQSTSVDISSVAGEFYSSAFASASRPPISKTPLIS
jgi:hypothetical protein